MKYIVIETQTTGDAVGTIAKAFDDFMQAEHEYHTILAAAAISTVTQHSCFMLTSSGSYLKSDSYSHNTETAEQEE